MRRLLTPLLALALLLAACGQAAVSQTTRTASFDVSLTLDAAQFGDRTATVEVRDRSGQPVDGEVTITPTMRSMGMASPEARMVSVGPGRYQSQGGVAFTMIGEWELDVLIAAAGREELASFNVEVTE